MRWQTTAVLAAVLIALGAFYYVYEIRLGPEREKVESRKGRIFSAESGEVNEISVERPGETLQFKKESDGWVIVQPVKARGDQGAIDGLVSSMMTARSDREITAAAANPSEFGLDRPAAKLTAKLKDGKQLGLTLGAKSPTGAWVYGQEAGKPAVMAVSESLERDAAKPLADFRDRTVLAFQPKDVTGVQITTRDDTMDVESADGKWKLKRPVALDADADQMREFLDKLQSGRVKEFVAENPPSLEPYGLVRSVRVAIQTGKDKERATRELLLGRVDDQKKGVYAMRPGESTVLLLPDEIWNAVPKNVATLRDKTVIDFDRDKVARVEMESPKGPITLVREGEQWKITQPEPLPADQAEAGAVLMKLKDLRAQAFLSEDASGIAKYLAKPDVRVTVVEQNTPKTVLLAPSPERRGGRPSAYAAVAGRGPVVLVDGKAIEDLSRSVTDLRDRRVLPDLEPKNVKRLRMKSGGQSIVLERSGESDWKVVEPKKGGAKSTKVEDLLYTFRSLRWKDIADAEGKEPAKYGLEAPTFEATLLRQDGTEIATLSLSKRDADRAYLKTKASPTIYSVDPHQIGDLPKIPDDIQS
jgi:Domain of unknown function (DUF4340)